MDHRMSTVKRQTSSLPVSRAFLFLVVSAAPTKPGHSRHSKVGSDTAHSRSLWPRVFLWIILLHGVEKTSSRESSHSVQHTSHRSQPQIWKNTSFSEAKVQTFTSDKRVEIAQNKHFRSMVRQHLLDCLIWWGHGPGVRIPSYLRVLGCDMLLTRVHWFVKGWYLSTLLRYATPLCPPTAYSMSCTTAAPGFIRFTDIGATGCHTPRWGKYFSTLKKFAESCHLGWIHKFSYCNP